jgi:hypothetical protein
MRSVDRSRRLRCGVSLAPAAVFMLGILPGILAQQPPPAPAAGGAVILPLLFREEWRQPPYEGELTDEKRRIIHLADAVGNPNLELKLYGPDSKDLLMAQHEGRHDLWTGLVLSPIAATLRDKTRYIDLTGRSRIRWIIRTQSLHVIHPVVKLADGTLLAGNFSIMTDGDFLESEVSFGNQRWYKLDPDKLVTTVEIKNPNLSKVDEIGFVDLMPSGGKGFAGWSNVSVVEVYAKSVPREGGSH